MKATKIVIAGGTGFLGRVLLKEFRNADEIVILTREPKRPEKNRRYVSWDARTMSGWEHELEGADVLINLAGKSVDCRYTPVNKHAILHSRVDSTNVLAMAVMCCQHPPKHWLNASTATIYRHSPDREMDEYTGETGDDFSMDVAKAWEAAFFEIDTPKTLKTALRTGIVLGKDGGAFPAWKNLVQYGMGGRQGDGKQFISWIHERDFARAVAFIIERGMTGKVNLVSPHPVRNATFMKAMRRAMRVPAGIPLGKRLLELGAKLIGTETELILKSRNAVPKRLLGEGFRFAFTKPGTAIENLIAP